MFIKNITCSSVVGSTILMTSKSLIQTNNLNIHPNINLINITSRFLFLSSLFIELLLDIKDIKGDRENNILTIPIYIGHKKTLELLIIIFISNLLYQSCILWKYKKYKLLFGFILSKSIFLNGLFKLRYKSINDEKIYSVLKYTTISLLIFIMTIIYPF